MIYKTPTSMTENNVFLDAGEMQGLAGNKLHIFGAEIRNAREPNRESVWVHNVVTVRTDKVAGQCAMPYTPFRCAKQNGD